MRILTFFIVLFFSSTLFAQDDFLAKQYLNDGDFEKAVIFYEKLTKKNPRRTDYAEGLVTCYQQLGRYEAAETFLSKKIELGNTYPTLFIELGYNYALQEFPDKAKVYYEKALAKIEENPNFGYGVGYRFQRYTLLDYAIKAYGRAMELNPKLDYNFQLARIYGEQGAIEKMYASYLKLIQNGKASKANVLRNIDDFISPEAEHPNNISFKKVLLRNAQQNPDLLWNELLSWLFVQQKQYGSAFSQEKAIVKRSEDGALARLEDLGKLALEDKAIKAAIKIYEYIIDASVDPVTTLNAQLHRIDIKLLEPSAKVFNEVEKDYEVLLNRYGYKATTFQLQIAYANFLTFKKEKPQKAITLLKNTLDLPLNRFGAAYVKMALGDILVFDQKFNQALIYFSQVQKSLKNDIIGQNARFKVAQTSFYKGDFDWAFTQLKVLRSSTSQLIANDAMQLSLLISDNSLEDSTQTALKKYARADLLAYQNKNTDAIEVFNDILENHKGEKIEDEALFRQAQLLQSQKAYDAAKFNYQKIIEFYGDGILADDSHFALGEMYVSILNEPEKAKQHFEKIIYNYQDSYYFPDARKKYRRLRGDIIN